MDRTWFKMQTIDSTVYVELVPSEHRFWPSEILRQQPLPTKDMRGRRVEISGQSSGWFYAHVAATATLAGAADVTAISAAPEGVTSDLSHHQIELWSAEGDAAQTIVEMAFDGSHPLSSQAVSQVVSLAKNQLAQRHPKDVCLTGQAPNGVYADLAAFCVRLGCERISWFSPRGGMIDVYFRDVKKAARLLGPRLIPESWRSILMLASPGRWIGVVGDPNIGKSVFSSMLDYHRRCVGLTGWRLDCDGQAPTPPWFLESTVRGDSDSANQRRLQGKRNWTAEMEAAIAEQMLRMRESLPVLIADLPGGDHRPTPARRIPPGRERLFAPLNALVLLERADCRSEPDWRSALAPHGLEHIIAAVITSQAPTSAPSLVGQVQEGVWRGLATGLDRSHALAEIRDAMLPAIDELWKHVMQFSGLTSM